MKRFLNIINILSLLYGGYLLADFVFVIYYPTPISTEKRVTDKSDYKEFCLAGIGGEDGKFTAQDSNGSERIIDCNNL